MLENLSFPFNETLTNPDEFYGRVRERTLLMTRVRSGSSTSIVGPRRIGKSWLLTYLNLVIPYETGPIARMGFLSGDSPSIKTLDDFIAGALQELGGLTPGTGRTRSRVSLEQLDRFVKEQRTRRQVLVLYIDEFESLCERGIFTQQVLQFMRSICQAGLGLVTVSKCSLIEITIEGRSSPFFNIFEQVVLKPFTVEEAREFVRHKGEQADLSLEEQEKLLLYAQDESRLWPPAKLQLAGKQLLGDKLLAQNGTPHIYRPQDPHYWREFQERVEQTYSSIVRPQA
jgi:hypothetical protein